jgi:hypothetical protein
VEIASRHCLRKNWAGIVEVEDIAVHRLEAEIAEVVKLVGNRETAEIEKRDKEIVGFAEVFAEAVDLYGFDMSPESAMQMHWRKTRSS